MDDKTFYSTINSDKAAFDKVLYDLEKMAKDAPYPRTRTAALTAIQNLNLIREICLAFEENEKKTGV